MTRKSSGYPILIRGKSRERRAIEETIGAYTSQGVNPAQTYLALVRPSILKTRLFPGLLLLRLEGRVFVANAGNIGQKIKFAAR